MSSFIEYKTRDGDKRQMLLPDSISLENFHIIAKSDVHVLITGETGSGKDELAQALWYHSNRQNRVYKANRQIDDHAYINSGSMGQRKRPLTYIMKDGEPICRSINCAAISSNHILSELFGHVKGAYTGADEERAGILKWMNRGTVILEEIGELSRNDQAALLRFIQTSEIRKLGSDQIDQKVDVRVIATTNVDTTNDATFRRDLKYRFAYTINVPPLRERLHDIPFLVASFMEKNGYYAAIGLRRLMELMSYGWPGNIRQLYTYCNLLNIHAESLLREAISQKLEVNPSDRIVNRNVWTKVVGEWTDELSPMDKYILEEECGDVSNLEDVVTYAHIARLYLGLQEKEYGDKLLKMAEKHMAVRNSLTVLAALADLDYCDKGYDIYIRLIDLRHGGFKCAKMLEEPYDPNDGTTVCLLVEYLNILSLHANNPELYISNRRHNIGVPSEAGTPEDEEGFGCDARIDISIQPSSKLLEAIRSFPSQSAPIDPIDESAIHFNTNAGRKPGRDIPDEVLVKILCASAEQGEGIFRALKNVHVPDRPKELRHQSEEDLSRRIRLIEDLSLRKEARGYFKLIRKSQ